MLIKYDKRVGLILGFPLKELKVALGVMRGIYKISPHRFLEEAISDLENELKQKELRVTNYHHICQNCFRDLDSRDPNAYNMTTRDLKGEEDSRWIHYVCQDLKPNRPE